NFQLEQLQKWVEQYFGGWQTPPPAPLTIPVFQPPKQKRLHIVDRPGAVQSTVKVIAPAIGLGHPHYRPLTIWNEILGGGVTSRLFLELRQKRGYTYGIGSHIRYHLRACHFGIKTSVRAEVTLDTLRCIEEQIHAIQNNEDII